MDKKKTGKEEKVGSDGLTKKERRALKVQAKQTDDNKAELKINQKIKETEVKMEDKAAPTEPPTNSQEKNDNLSEKQKRKLEWEKKQAEQKQLEDKIVCNKTKAELKAMRRALQEAQRLAKMSLEEKNQKNNKPKAVEVGTKTEEKKPIVPTTPKVCEPQEGDNVKLFKYLMTPYSFKPLRDIYPSYVPNVHPAFIEFGVLYSTGALPGSNEKTIRFLEVIESMVNTLEVSDSEEFCTCLETVLDKGVEFLQQRKHVTYYMLNVYKSFKTFLEQLDKNLSQEEKKEELVDFIDIFIQDQIIKAGIAISLKVKEALFEGDVILVYGWSSQILNIILESKEKLKSFKVIIVDSRPSFGGEEMLKRISEARIRHEYVMIHSLSHIMPEVTKVLLEAEAIMTNGYLLSKAGTAQIAMMAKSFNKPVLVCCETYKFTEKEQTDGMVCNEVGNPDLLLENLFQPSPLKKEEVNKPTRFNLLNSLTPPDLVNAVYTELAILPSTSVPSACKAARILNM